MKQQNFERELPQGYRQVFYLNAKSVKVGVILNLVAIAVLAVIMMIAVVALALLADEYKLDTDPVRALIALWVFLLAMIAYIVLHELVHGIAYKSLTGEKLTFGLSWSCAFCGVPKVYTYRKTALIALVSPLIVFSVVLIALTVALYFVSPIYYLMSAFLFGLHLGGCCGDIYVTLLFLFKFKDKRTLMRDTGPEQFFYVIEE